MFQNWACEKDQISRRHFFGRAKGTHTTPLFSCPNIFCSGLIYLQLSSAIDLLFHSRIPVSKVEASSEIAVLSGVEGFIDHKMVVVSSVPSEVHDDQSHSKSPSSDNEKKNIPSTVSPATVASKGTPLSSMKSREDNGTPNSAASPRTPDDLSWTPAHVRIKARLIFQKATYHS